MSQLETIVRNDAGVETARLTAGRRYEFRFRGRPSSEVGRFTQASLSLFDGTVWLYLAADGDSRRVVGFNEADVVEIRARDGAVALADLGDHFARPAGA